MSRRLSPEFGVLNGTASGGPVGTTAAPSPAVTVVDASTQDMDAAIQAALDAEPNAAAALATPSVEAEAGRNPENAIKTVRTNGNFRLDVSIINRANGKHHWQAWTTTNQGHTSGGDVILAMVPKMVSKIGERVTSQTFDLF